MSKTLDKLTPEQEAMIPKYIEKYTKLGLSTKPFEQDKTRLNGLMKAVYENADLKAPDNYIYVRSPLEAVKAYRFFLTTFKDDKIETIAPYIQNGELVGDWETVSKNSFDSFPDEVKKEIQSQTREVVNQFCYGSHDAGWTAFCDFFKTECDIPGLEKIEPLKAIVGEIGWFLPCQSTVIVSQNPTEIHVANEKLHNTEGPAIKYADGFGVFVVDGVRKENLMEVMFESMKESAGESLDKE